MSRPGSGRAARRGRDKHTAFYRLLEACAEPECPICHLARRRLEQYFDGLLYEKVNDREIRRRFRTAGGFCNPHSHQFAGYNDGLAGSILYRDLLEAWLQRGFELPVQDPSGVLAGCPACREKSRSEESYLLVLADFLEDDQLRQALLASDGLCLAHLGRLEERLKARRRSFPAWLTDFQRSLIEGILADLNRYLDSCNFSLGDERPQLTREQERAWKRALRKAAGFPAEVQPR